MTAKFICPACWHSVDFADDWVGKTVKCPECHARGPVTLVPGIITTCQETTDMRVAASVEPRSRNRRRCLLSNAYHVVGTSSRMRNRRQL
jgi:hypothetical protein